MNTISKDVTKLNSSNNLKTKKINEKKNQQQQQIIFQLQFQITIY